MRTLSLLCLLLFMVSCNKNQIYHKLDEDFPESRWQNKVVKRFEFEIEDSAPLYNFVLLFSHVSDYQFSSVPIKIRIESPSGKAENIAIDLKIKEDNGKDIADCAGDYCDLKYKFKSKERLEKGRYKVYVGHSFPGPYLPNVIGVGLNVERSR